VAFAEGTSEEWLEARGFLATLVDYISSKRGRFGELVLIERSAIFKSFLIADPSELFRSLILKQSMQSTFRETVTAGMKSVPDCSVCEIWATNEADG
jgi:hypothetical protein